MSYKSVTTPLGQRKILLGPSAHRGVHQFRGSFRLAWPMREDQPWEATMNSRTLTTASLCLGLLAAAPAAVSDAQATSYDLLTTQQGWIHQSGQTSSGFRAGICANPFCSLGGALIGETRNFLAFNVPVLDGPLVSATLRLNLAEVLGETPFDPVVYRVTSLSSLTFAGLGTGTFYGSRIFTPGADDFATRDIALGTSALNDIGFGGFEFFVSG